MSGANGTQRAATIIKVKGLAIRLISDVYQAILLLHNWLRRREDPEFEDEAAVAAAAPAPAQAAAAPNARAGQNGAIGRPPYIVRNPTAMRTVIESYCTVHWQRGPSNTLLRRL